MKPIFVVLLTLITLGCGYNANMAPRGSTQLMQVLPTTVNAGGPSFMLTANGNGFSTNSVVYWNGMPLGTRFLNTSQLVASVPASLIAVPETVQVYVLTNGATSNTVNLAVN